MPRWDAAPLLHGCRYGAVGTAWPQEAADAGITQLNCGRHRCRHRHCRRQCRHRRRHCPPVFLSLVLMPALLVVLAGGTWGSATASAARANASPEPAASASSGSGPPSQASSSRPTPRPASLATTQSCWARGDSQSSTAPGPSSTPCPLLDAVAEPRGCSPGCSPGGCGCGGSARPGPAPSLWTHTTSR